MRYCLILTLFFSLAFTISAQDDVLMPDDLPHPILSDEIIENIYFADVTQFAWFDSETLLFEIGEQGYTYSLSNDTLTELDISPFRAEMNQEFLTWYQVLEGTEIIQSPYPEAGDDWYTILYASNLTYNCGATCDGRIYMSGMYRNSGDNQPDSDYVYHPLPFGGMPSNRILWSRDSSSAIVTLESAYVVHGSMYHLNLQTNETTQIPVELSDISDSLLAISDDGNRVAFRSSMSFDNYPSGQKIIIWETPYHDDLCACTYDGQTHIISPFPLVENRGNSFAGVGFVDEDTILYIGEMGLMRHNLLTGVSSIIDPELNVGWIHTAVFSPDNQHVAITTQQGLYILALSL